MWNTIAKYDVISVHFEDDGFEKNVKGEVINISPDEMIVREEGGNEWVIERSDLVDLDHLSYADRTEVYRH